MKLLDKIKSKDQAPFMTNKDKYTHGGAMGRNMQAIFTPKKRGKIKGYMKA